MGIQYQAIAMYGKYFSDDDELEAYVLQHFPNVTIPGVEEEFEGEPKLSEIQFTCLNYWTGDGYLLGIPMEFGVSITDYSNIWNAAFPAEDGQIHQETQVY